MTEYFTNLMILLIAYICAEEHHGDSESRDSSLSIDVGALGFDFGPNALHNAAAADRAHRRSLRGNVGVGARAWVHLFQNVRTAETPCSCCWLTLPLALHRATIALKLRLCGSSATSLYGEQSRGEACVNACAAFLFGNAQRTLDMWR